MEQRQRKISPICTAHAGFPECVLFFGEFFSRAFSYCFPFIRKDRRMGLVTMSTTEEAIDALIVSTDDNIIIIQSSSFSMSPSSSSSFSSSSSSLSSYRCHRHRHRRRQREEPGKDCFRISDVFATLPILILPPISLCQSFIASSSLTTKIDYGNFLK